MAYEQLKRKSETSRCLLCQDAPCSSCCPKGLAVADIVRSLFRGPGVPLLWLPRC